MKNETLPCEKRPSLVKATSKLSLMVFLACALTLASPSDARHSEKGSAAMKSDNRAAIRLNIAQNPLSLDPRDVASRRDAIIPRMLMEGLTRLDQDENPSPAMAESIEISDDGLIYTFHLRNALWSDGQPVTARDFEYGWKSALLPQFGQVCPDIFFPIQNARAALEGRLPVDFLGARATNAKTFVVYLEHPCPIFLEFCTHPAFSPIRQEIDEKNPRWSRSPATYISNGPFRLVKWADDEEIAVEKNPLYWDAKSVGLDEIHLSMLQEATAVLSLFEEKQLDWAGLPLSELPRDALPSLKRNGQLEIDPTATLYCYHFNMKRPPFDSLKMRQAFVYALDMGEAVLHLLGGGETVATSLLPASLTQYHEPLLTQPELKAERERAAIRLFEEALQEQGYTRESLPPITICYSMVEGYKAFTECAQSRWASLFQIPIQLQGSDPKFFLAEAMKKEGQITAFSWCSWFNDPYSLLSTYRDLSGSHNFSNVNLPEFTRLLWEGHKKLLPSQRKEVFAQAEELLMSHYPAAPAFNGTLLYVKNPQLQGVVIPRSGWVDFKWASLAHS